MIGLLLLEGEQTLVGCRYADIAWESGQRAVFRLPGCMSELPVFHIPIIFSPFWWGGLLLLVEALAAHSKKREWRVGAYSRSGMLRLDLGVKARRDWREPGSCLRRRGRRLGHPSLTTTVKNKAPVTFQCNRNMRRE